jgi:hypothetical protein
MEWTKREVRLIVEDYFRMLQLELADQAYNKTKFRNTLLPQLEKRKKGAIEFKHQNISAALINMGLPFIEGYKPLFNYQKRLLEQVISEYILQHTPQLERTFQTFAEQVVLAPSSSINSYNILDDAPLSSGVKESDPLYRPMKTNFLEKEQNNRLLGEEGEKFVIRYERIRLIEAGKENLAEKIEWVSKEFGDGLGYDILSRNTNGSDRYIEVKTTKLSKETPIYISRTELSFAKSEKNFFLYRVFDFDTKPRLFIKNGDYDRFCTLSPQTYKGYF